MAVLPYPSKQSTAQPVKRESRVIDFTAENIQGIEPPTDADRIEYKDSKEQGLYLRVRSDACEARGAGLLGFPLEIPFHG